MPNMGTRMQLLENLLNYSCPLEKIEDGLKMHPWDSSKYLIFLDSRKLSLLLERYLKKQVTASELEHWANLIEMREDIGFTENEETLISSIIVELANPALFGELSEQSVSIMLDRLS